MASIVGLDIGSYSIKAIETEKKGDQVSLSSIVSTYNPVGHFVPSDQKQYEMLLAQIKTMLTENKLIGKKVALSLPENFVYSSIVEMPWLSDAELSSAITWEAEQHLPVSLDSVNLEYSVLSRPENQNQGKMKLLLVAAKKDIVERLVTTMEYLEMDLIAIEPASLALGRAFVFGGQSQEAALLCNMGALTTDVVVVVDGKPVFMHTITTGGLALTRSIEKGLGLQPSQAEEYKRSYGLSRDQLEGKVANTLTSIFNTILAELKKSIQFYQSEGGGQIAKIVLYGGSSYLPALVPYITETLGTETVIANPFENVQPKEGVRLPKEVASFGVAFGLSIREEE